MKHKIAIYSGEIPSTTFIERLINGLSQKNYDIYIFGFQKNKVKYNDSLKLISYSNKLSKIFLLCKYHILLSLFFRKEKKKLDEIIKARNGNLTSKLKFYPVLYHKPDIFHLQWAKGVEEWIWVKEFGIKYIVSLRGTHVSISPYANNVLKEMYKMHFPLVDFFHAVSNTMANEVINYSVNHSKIKVIYSGLDFKFINYYPKKMINKPYKILSIGREHWVKGYNYAIDACKILSDNNFNYIYKIIGIENSEDLVFQRNQLQLNDKVIFENKIAFDALKKEIYKADILILPSVEEGIANVVLEAMAAGTLVITTDCGGMKELILDGVNGFVVPMRNPTQLANSIQECSLLSIEKYNEVTLNARKTVETNHSMEKMVGDFNQMYKFILCE